LGDQSPNLFEESGKTEHIGLAALDILLMGPIIGAITGGLLNDPALGLIGGVLFSVVAVSSGVLIGAVTPGLSSERLTPNDRLRRYGLYTLIGATAGLLVGGFVGLFLGSPISLAVGTLLGGIFLGGASCLQILTLRVLLILNGLTPWRYVRFLDQAVNNLLLRRSGATYVFTHRLLQDHFAQVWSGKRAAYPSAILIDNWSALDEISSSELEPSDESRVVAIQDVRNRLLSREEEESLQRNQTEMEQPPQWKAIDPSSPWAHREDINSALVRLERVSKVYGGSLVALDDVSLNVGKGELIVIRGPSGSGKSTLLRLMLGEEHPTIGRVWVSGRDLSRLTGAELQYLRRSIGSVFEVPYLIANKTAWENISFALEALGYRAGRIRRQVDLTLSRLGLADRAAHFPHEFNVLDQYFIAIGRAVVNRPTLILCDTPAEVMNREGLETIAYRMEEVNRMGVTVIVTWASDVEMPFTQGHVCILEGGRLLCT
jgi:cell division transport system ATP-binding protein